MRVAPKRTRAEVPWRAPYRYVCPADHYIEADHPLAACPAYHLGEPCGHPLSPPTRHHQPRRQEP